MMMTSGTGVHYKSLFDAFSQIIAKEGPRSLMKGAGANIVRGVASAGVLALYDKFQELAFGKVYSGGAFSRCSVLQGRSVDTVIRFGLILRRFFGHGPRF